MKYVSIIIVSFGLITGSALAQDDTGSGSANMFFGLKAGANYSNVYDSDGEEFTADSKIGFAGGLFLTIPIGEFIGVQPEILYSQRGFTGKGRLLGLPYEVKRTSNYVDIPLFVSIKPIEYVSIVAGPQFSFLVNQKDEFKNGITSIEQEQDFENDNIRKNTVCLVGGLDINVQHLVVGARVGADLLKNDGDGNSSTPRYKNTWGQLTVGYRLY